MIRHWKGLDMEITDAEYHHDRTLSGDFVPFQTLNLKHVEIMKLSDKPRYNTSLERSLPGNHRF